VRWLADQDKVAGALEELQEALNLEQPPNRIETYDISNIQGTSAVGSMVVFEGGRSKNSAYRRFKIRTVPGPDDYTMMQEMLRRRFRNGKERAANPPPEGESKGWENMPDLVLIDGGKGHLNAALEVMLQLGLGHVPIASIAKQEELVFIPDMDDPIVLPRNSEGLYLVQRMRDEAHRFAITYHRNVRSKRSITSALDEIGSIGPKRKKALLRHFGSVQAVREADVEAIAAVPGMTRRLAEKVKGAL
jgi:excinuclease ABC subunit C